MTVAMDDWAEAVRKAIENNPDQPDCALLSRMLDEATSLEATSLSDGDVAAVRQQVAEIELRRPSSLPLTCPPPPEVPSL